MFRPWLLTFTPFTSKHKDEEDHLIGARMETSQCALPSSAFLLIFPLFYVVVSFSSNFLFFCRSSVIATCKASKMQTNRFLDCKNVLYIVVHLVIFFISRYSNSKMPLEFMLSNHKRNMLLHDNFLYYRWSDNYWRCRLRSCGATVKTSGETTEGTVVSKSKAGHNHMEHSLAELECMRAITRLNQRAEEETSEKYQTAHDRERCHLRSIGLTTADLAAFFDSVRDIRSTLDKRSVLYNLINHNTGFSLSIN